MPQRPMVSVLGSLNADICVSVPRLPGPGETVLGSAAAISPGGKGANQAVAASRLGAAVRMNGCRGGDEFGQMLDAALRAEGVGTSGVRVVPDVSSGVALITVDAAGENMITVAPGANAQVTAADAASALADGPDVLVLSAEVPAAALRAGLAAARAAGVVSMLNLAPVPVGASELLADGVHWLVVNAPEAQALSGLAVTDPRDALAAASRLAAAGPRNVVVTLGADGAALAGEGGAAHVPGFRVTAVDSVGAGDAFVGALAVAVAAGVPAEAAVRAACAAGAAAATRPGAQAGLPGPGEVRAVTGAVWPVAV